MKHIVRVVLISLIPAWAWASAPAEDADRLPSHEAVMKAMVTELERAMSDLVMEDLERPYFIHYAVDDSVAYMLNAEYGSLTASRRMRQREFSARVRVRSYAMDNTNFVARGGVLRPTGRGGDGGGVQVAADRAAVGLAGGRIEASVVFGALDDVAEHQAIRKKREFMGADAVRGVELVVARPIYREAPAAVFEWDEVLQVDVFPRAGFDPLAVRLCRRAVLQTHQRSPGRSVTGPAGSPRRAGS